MGDILIFLAAPAALVVMVCFIAYLDYRIDALKLQLEIKKIKKGIKNG